ncbi:unnamed protein product [Prorocentrum cordatum]|uniref:Uncharacterized protein n=1 Tax=Prorocentrum cordatum TaxID=2364126 RepID=A0ABN9WUK1_9DINO|nr:unnamed protein product [Polarella glacialis]
MKLHRAVVHILTVLGCSRSASGAPGSVRRAPAAARVAPRARTTHNRVVSAAATGARVASSGHLGAANHSTTEGMEKVITLLTELQESIEKDGESEQAGYDRYACWCETFTQKQALAVTLAKEQLQSFGNSILKLKGDLATYVAEIAKLLKDIEENEQAQAATTKVRQDESAAFAAESTELHQALTALEKALTVLGNATAGMSLEQATAGEPALRTLLKDVAAVAGKLPAHGQLGQAQLSALQAAADRRYTPQSASIQGILKDMYATFASDLEQKTTQEAAAHRLYEDYMATKQSELLILQESVGKKQAAKSEAELMLSDATEGYGDTEAQLAASVELFDNTKATCTGKADQWAERKQLRADELDGISKALELLTSEEAKEAFSKAKADGVAAAFLQLRAARGAGAAAARARAVEALGAVARRTGSLRLASAVADLMEGGRASGVGHFDVVITEIDKIIVQLREEDSQDQKNVDECKQQYQDIESEVNELGWKIAKSQAHLKKLSTLLQEKGNEKDGVVAEMESVQKEIVDMNATRVAENSAFIQQKADDQKAIDLLKEAIAFLSKYYETNGIASESFLLQRSELGAKNVSSQPPDLKFSHKTSRETQTKGVVALLNHLVEDLEGEMESDIKGEEDAQLDYEKQVKAAMQLEAKLQARRTSIEDTIVQLNAEVTEEEESVTENEGLQTGENETLASIKPGCDWIVANAPERRKKREVEADGLRSAKEYLAGFQPAGATVLAEAAAHVGRPWARPRGRFRRPAGAALQVAATGGARRGR